MRTTLLQPEVIFKSDLYFNRLYPQAIQDLSPKHWTPLSVVRKAAKFLASEPGIKILDVGSGVGKFCIAGGYFHPDAIFFGVEQRASLCEIAKDIQQQLGVHNVAILNKNFTQLNMGDYQNFYFFNPFYENLSGTEKIDDSIAYTTDLYHYYNRYLYKQLQLRPVGTRVATYHSLEEEMPADYHVVGTDMDNWLKYWIKV